MAGRIFDGYRMISPGWVSIRNGLIEHVSSGIPHDCATDELQPDLLVTPGFVDTHAHGAGGASFGGTADEVRAALLTHREHGTTSMFASLVSAPMDTMTAQVRALAPHVHDDLLAGIHLEGPWLSPAFAGAHHVPHLSHPSTSALADILEVASGTLRMVTVAPELPDAPALIRELSRSGVAPAIGHTGCSYEEAMQAMDCGARIATHLFNAMPTMHHRNPGPVLALLQADHARLEVIADGIHVHDALLRWLFAQSPDQLILVSDAMAGAGLGDGTYVLGGQRVTVSNRRARLTGTETLAGSAFTLHEMVRHAVRVVGADLTHVLRAATSIPSRAHHLDDAGHLSAGVPASVVIMNPDLELVEVVYRGHPVERGHQPDRQPQPLEPRVGLGAEGCMKPDTAAGTEMRPWR